MDDDLTRVRHLLAEPPPPAPDVVAAARATLDQATRNHPRRLHQPHRAHRLVAVAAAALLLAGGAVYGVTAGLGSSATHRPAATTALTTVAGCASFKVAIGRLETIRGTSLVLRTLSGQQQTVTTSRATDVNVVGAPLSDIANGQRAAVVGRRSRGEVAARVVNVGIPPHATLPAGAPLVAIAGTVTHAASGGFTLVTRAGAHIRVTTSNWTNVVLSGATLSQFRIGADILAIGHAGSAGTLAAGGVSQVPHLPSQAHFRVTQTNGCSTSAITTAYLAAASVRTIP
jgi:hypothetical protein